MRFIISYSILFLFILTCNHPPAESVQKPDDKKAAVHGNPVKDRRIEREMRSLSEWLVRNTGSQYIPSSAVVIVSHDRVIFKKTVQTTSRRAFSIASFTKTFTALAVLHLADRGLLKLDDPVSRYLAVRLEREGMNSEPIRVRHLLNHTSGIADRGEFRTIALSPPLAIPLQRYPAGYQFAYSNSGYNLLSRLVYEVSGLNLRDYITEHILRPLEMKDSVAPKTMKGSGGMRCSVDDMGNYLMMLLGRGSFKGRIIVSREIFEEMFKQSVGIPPSRNKEFRGIAWRVWTVDDRLYSYNHASLWYGAGGWMQLFPDIDVGYIFMSDTPDFKLPIFNRFFNGLKSRLLRFSGLFCINEIKPEAFKPSLPDINLLEKFSGRYYNPLNRASIEVLLKGGYLVARESPHKGYRLIPTTVNTFIHRREMSPKVLNFDFTWGDKRVIGLATRYGYYMRE
jgi:CubicO group peptidase (beta-lactamase class C family)